MKKNKRGQIVNTTTGVAVGLAVFILIFFAILLGLSSLNPGSFFTAASPEQNATNQMVSNFTTGGTNFFSQVPTAMTILGVVLILGVLAILIVIVLRIRSQTGAGGGGL